MNLPSAMLGVGLKFLTAAAKANEDRYSRQVSPAPPEGTLAKAKS